MNGWEPIETAPKDGTQILVTNGKGYAICQYLFDKWWSMGLPFGEEITKWMRLPELPK